MSSEVPEGVAPSPERRPSRGEGGAPVSGALTIVLAVVAVVAGFLILRAITGDNGTADGPPGGATVTQPTEDGDDPDEPTPTDPPAPTSTTEPPLVTDGAIVVVANANGVNGSAGAMSELLDGAGFEMGTPTNASTGQLATTVIYYDPSVDAAQTVAESVNRVLGGDAPISQVGTPAPTSSGEIDGSVLVMLGNDKANTQSLDELAPAADDGDDDEEASTVTAPEVSGGDDGGETGDDEDDDAETD